MQKHYTLDLKLLAMLYLTTFSIEVKFVLGQQCYIHPDDRTDEWSCQFWNVSADGMRSSE